MTLIGNHSNSTQDDQLANFTDQALADNARQIEANSTDEELLELEKTILRLKKAIPPVSLETPAIKQMQARFNARVKREAREIKQPFWKKWFEPQFRPQFGMAFATVALLITLAVFSPSFSNADSSTTAATALTPMGNTFTIIALAGIILVFLWIKFRK